MKEHTDGDMLAMVDVMAMLFVISSIFRRYTSVACEGTCACQPTLWKYVM